MTDHLFVYGTLAPGRPNAHILAGVSGQWTPATVRGVLHADGWGAALGYPGIVLADSADEVQGLVFSSPDLPRLDDFEGEGYVRVPVKARLHDGGLVDAFIYALSERPPHSNR